MRTKRCASSELISENSTVSVRGTLNSNDIHVAFQNVQKSYDGHMLVVKDLNVDISRGEFLTLLGPSGSG